MDQNPFLKNIQPQTNSDQFQSMDQNPFLKNIAGSGKILPNQTHITQNFDNYNPELEVFSGGVAKDTNFATNDQTPVSVPQGQWQVVSTYDQANPQGFPGNPDNQGYGNAVMAKNAKTGDRLHFIHLSGVHVKPGDTILGGTVVGRTGSSGNATGPNLGLEYYDQAGQLQDVMQSPYAKSLPVDGQQAGAGGGGGYEEQIGQILSQGVNLLGQGINYGTKAIGKGINALISNPPSVSALSNPAQQSVLNQKMVSFPTATPPASPTAQPTQWHSDPSTTHFVPDGNGGFTEGTPMPKSPHPTAPVQASQAVNATDYENQAAPIFQKYGVPPSAGLGIWAMEGRGKTINPNNPYNIGAYDHNPQNANVYPWKTPIEGTEAAAKFIAGQSEYMSPKNKVIFQNALKTLKKNNDIEAYLRTIAPIYSSNPKYVETIMQTPEYLRWAGGN